MTLILIVCYLGQIIIIEKVVYLLYTGCPYHDSFRGGIFGIGLEGNNSSDDGSLHIRVIVRYCIKITFQIIKVEQAIGLTNDFTNTIYFLRIEKLTKFNLFIHRNNVYFIYPQHLVLL